MADRFCIYCGAELSESDTFCTACGAEIPPEGSVPAPDTAQGPAPTHQRSGGNLGSLGTLMLLYGIVAMIIALMLLATYIAFDTFWEMMEDDPAYKPIIDSYSKDDMKLGTLLSGATFLGSSICALISGYLTNKRENYNMAFLTCILATALSFSMIITLIIGIIVTIKLSSGKSEFISRNLFPPFGAVLYPPDASGRT